MQPGRVFPKNSRLDVDSQFRTTKTVDRSNAFSGLSTRKSPSRMNETTLFNEQTTQRSGVRSIRSGSSDPFDGTRRDVVYNLPGKGIRTTGMETIQHERGRRLEDNPRAQKRAVSQDRPNVDHSMSVFTAKGDLVRGRRGPSEYPGVQADWRVTGSGADIVAKQCQRARSSERFRLTPHPNTDHVLNPTPATEPDVQRSTLRFSRRPCTPTLHGVLHPVPERQPPAYRVRAPFYTDD